MKEKTKEKQKNDCGVTVGDKKRLEPPKMYKVIMFNDQTSTMDFVIQVLTSVFQKSNQEAVSLMLYIHNNNSGVCGIYTKDIAETKMLQVEHMAQTNNYPLKTTIEEE